MSIRNLNWSSITDGYNIRQVMEEDCLETARFYFCKTCQRSYAQGISPDHKKICEAKFAKLHDGPESQASSESNTASTGTTGSGKAAPSAESLRKGKKQILDLNKHCGVIIAPSGLPCMRSLACKSHSLASKRAVLGRKKDFDLLLADYMIAHPSRASVNKDKEKLLANVEGTSLAPSQSISITEELASKTSTASKANLAQSSTAMSAPSTHQTHTSVARPLVQRNQFSSYRVFSDLKLSSWLTEPLKLYSRSRLLGQQPPATHEQ